MALCICWLFVQQHSALQFCFHSLYKKYYFIISVPCHKCRGYVWTYWPRTSFRNPIISPYFPDGVHLNPCSQCSMQLSGSFLEGPSLALIFSPQAGCLHFCWTFSFSDILLCFAFFFTFRFVIKDGMSFSLFTSSQISSCLFLSGPWLLMFILESSTCCSSSVYI